MSGLLERDSELKHGGRDDNKPPIAHIAPWRNGSREALCGAPILGIRPPADLDYFLCERCIELNGGDPRQPNANAPAPW
jgi:hypothetical protein